MYSKTAQHAKIILQQNSTDRYFLEACPNKLVRRVTRQICPNKLPKGVIKLSGTLSKIVLHRDISNIKSSPDNVLLNQVGQNNSPSQFPHIVCQHGIPKHVYRAPVQEGFPIYNCVRLLLKRFRQEQKPKEFRIGALQNFCKSSSYGHPSNRFPNVVFQKKSPR